MQTIQKAVETIAIDLEKLDVEFKLSSAMAYQNPAIHHLDNKYLVVGYLTDDEDCENPLTSCDGMGVIHVRKNGSKEDIAEFQEALGLDSEYDLNIDLTYEHPKLLRKAWLEKAPTSLEFISWVDDDIRDNGRNRVKKDDRGEDFYRRRALKFLRDADYLCDIGRFEFTIDAMEPLCKDLIDQGKIGNKYAVLLDLYEHGGQSWSIRGEGMRCPWDTSRGAGVWVPDHCAKEELERREKVYAFGEVKCNGSWTRSSGKKRFWAVAETVHGPVRSVNFEQWHEAFAWLENYVKSNGLKMPRAMAEKEAMLFKGSRRAAEELARNAVEQYNEWLSGDCYGVITAAFVNVGDASSPDWQFEESEEVWGYIGSDFAMEEAELSAKNHAERFFASQTQSAIN